MVRDQSGKFVKGHPPMGGRPKKEKEEMYYRILMTTCTADDWAAIVQRAVYDAKKGDASARKWLADYLVGPPIERKEITGAGGGYIHVKVIGIDD